MIDFRLLSILISGLCSGAILGAAIPTNTERKIREWSGSSVLMPSGPLYKIVLLSLVKLLLLAAAFAAVGIGILTVAGAYPLCQPYDGYVLKGSWLGGAAIGKMARYFYWKRQEVWL